MAILSKEALLGRGQQQQVKEVLLGNGNSVFIRKMRAVDMYGKKNWNSKDEMFSTRCVHASLCDEKGELFFPPEQYDEDNLLQLSLDDFHRIWQEVLEFNGLNNREGEPGTAEKN